MEVEDLERNGDTSVVVQNTESNDSAEEDNYGEIEHDTEKSEKVKKLEEYESDLLSEHDMNMASDVDTESLTGSLDGATTGGDEYELTGDDTEYNSDPVTKHTKEEKQHMLALRRHLDLLSEQVVQNDYLVTQSREELKKCHENIDSLESELGKTAKEIELLEIDQNKSSLYRLKSHYKKLCNEIDVEQQVAVDITERLEKAEYSLSVATMEQGRFLLAGEELEKQEEIEKKNKAEISAGRIRKENVTAMTVEKRRRLREKDHITALRERERKHRQALAAAKRNREQASKFLKETMTKVRLKEAEDEEFYRANMENRIQNLLSLKANIESNKENLRAVEARAAHLRREEEQREKEEEEEVINQCLNPDEVLTRRKRIRQFEKDKEAFEKRQRERQIEIADKLLREEKQMKKRYQQQPQLWPEKQRDRNKRLGRRKPKSKALRVYSGSSSMEYSADAEDTAGTGFVQNKLIPVSSDDEDEFSPFGHTSRDEEQEGDSDNEGEDLAKPEFKGLWEEENQEEKDKMDQKLKFTNHIPSKMEQDMMEKALTKQKENIVQKQIAVGREFKGQAFYSKPEVVIFKDFDIGKTYRKKVVLTNVSYTQNFCKYIGMSNHLMDFIDVLYDPPGAMSAGLTCDFTVIFKPMLKEDLVGQVDFLAQTGPFSVPVKCLTKRCEITVDKNELNFGHQVLGETVKKTVLLVNEGALGTTFEVKKVLDDLEYESSLDLASDTTSPSNMESDHQESVEGEQLREKRKESKGMQSNLETVPEQDFSPVHSVPSSPRQQQIDSENNQDEQGSSIVLDEQDAGLIPPADSAFTIGKVATYDVAPFSSVQVELIFAPTKPGDSTNDFEITFSDEGSPPIFIKTQGTGVDLPVWVEREVVDLKICMFDRLYQDAIVVNNRATSALRLKLEVCKELRDHLELLPKTAYIQAESQFSAQLKFLPRRSLAKDCPSYFHPESGVLEAPMVIRVGDQTRPVCFTVRAVVTGADLEFSVQEVDFGYCTTTESVRQTITMTNKSILPQLYGFCGVPQCLDVQPNDGFGTLLPLESLDIDLIFSARKAKEYNVELVCKNGIGTEYRIPCKGIGVYPPLALSHSVISFRATAMEDSSTTSFFVMNSHTDSNEFTHEVPRVGRGPVAEVGPTSFEFIVPVGAPLNISPAVGVVKPGERCNVEVTLSPRLDNGTIKREALRIVEKMTERERKTSEENIAKEKPEEPLNVGKKRLAKVDKKSGKGSPKRGQTPSTIRHSATPAKTNYIEDVVEGSDEFNAAKLSLLKSFENNLSSYDIPCFVASGQSCEPGSLNYNPHNTLYVKVHCPVVTPDIVIISNSGKSVLAFEQASIGQRVVKDITIQNVSSSTIVLSSSVLDPHGPFQLLNATRSLEPGATHSCVVSFFPQSAHEFYEVLDLHSTRSTLHIKLKGKGVKPVVSSSVEHGILDFGYALVKDPATMTFKLGNTSDLVVNFNILLASFSASKHNTIPAYLAPHQRELVTGSSNYHGEVVFDCVPSCGTIEPGKVQEFTVTFTADHPSECYADELSIEINNTITEKVRLRARASKHIMYLQGWDEFAPCEESLCEIVHEEEEGVIAQKLVFLLFKSHSKRGELFSAAEKKIDIGCVKSSLSTKRSCEFVFENPKEANEKGFSFDPVKGSVDLGHKKQIVCRWQPTADHNPNRVVNCSTVIAVKGEVTIQYKILLRGLIVSN